MVNSTVRRENNFPTGKLLALSIIGILIFRSTHLLAPPRCKGCGSKKEELRTKIKKVK